MLLSKELQSKFGSQDRSRGSRYQRQGRVNVLSMDNGVIVADVEGNYDNYEVRIDLEKPPAGNGLSCDCPRFANGYLCKHLWAVILELDQILGSQFGLSSSPKSQSKGKSRKETPAAARKRNQPKSPSWQMLLSQVRPGFLNGAVSAPVSPRPSATETKTEILYLIDIGSDTENQEGPILSVMQRMRTPDGQWGQLTPRHFSRDTLSQLVDETDRHIARHLLGAEGQRDRYYYLSQGLSLYSEFQIDPFWSPALCQALVESKRFFWTLDKLLPFEEFFPIEAFDLEVPAHFHLEVSEEKGTSARSIMHVALKRNGQRIDNGHVVMITENGMLLLHDRIVHLTNPGLAELWADTKDAPPVEITAEERQPFLSQLAELEIIDRLDVPETWDVQRVEIDQPQPTLDLTNHPYREKQLKATILFSYGGTEVLYSSHQSTFYDPGRNAWFERKTDLESRRFDDLSSFPIVFSKYAYEKCDFTIRRKHLTELVDQLGERGWVVRLQGKPFRRSATIDIAIESSQDWFDLTAQVDFEGETIDLPQLLQAVARKEQYVVLADGSRGRIPDDFAGKYARLASLGQINGDKVRFRPSQAMLLDAMLDAREVRLDKPFRRFREKLSSFRGVQPKSAPRGFCGELREYQTEGLGWLHFLNDFQLGGCLADDMGLGKTIQVLSLLEQRRTRRIAPQKSSSRDTTIPGAERNAVGSPTRKKKAAVAESSPLVTLTPSMKRKPSLVVVPKSLIFNWIEEAARFTPRLRILNYTGTGRRENVEEAFKAGGFDVLITTYGTMQKDIAILSQVEFDYIILDESQAIKNAKTLCSKASRLLRADHRLAMTGTPIENHLGELWSLFEFLNPGMLGSSSGFARLTNQKKGTEAEREETLDALGRAIQPYLLRRTKEQVLTELPPKTEQTLYCDMLPAQKKAYMELKEYYRVKLTKKVETDGMARSKIHVLEALLRLRQVACDPRLVDNTARRGAKLELLQTQLAEILSEGHKVLVFSQFTSFLDLVRKQFDQGGIRYEYLDGQSTKRAASVKRFQTDPDVQAFLISIKAGGHGLNLTAADYVFLLDPWWNPAVESQAIDRAHRLGQDNPVIAYRLVCRDTVEEKILKLQAAKRDLADKIVRSDESLIRTLSADDLQLLFS